MTSSIRFENEPESNQARQELANDEPLALRTYTPTQAIFARSAGLYHWTPDGRRLADFSSGVLVSNLGHNPRNWLERLLKHMHWDKLADDHDRYVTAPPLTAYNAATSLEIEACRRLLDSLHQAKGGARLKRVMWSASGSEGIQKALWACLKFQPEKNLIVATRGGFHGKKGLAGAVTGDENSPERDPRVRFIAFPKQECADVSLRGKPFDPTPYRNELEELAKTTGDKLNCLITEPYLGGGGSFHPPPAYLQMLVDFCRRHNMVFILDEVQSNFGRTGSMYAFETYGIEPDVVVLGKGMGNGIPVNAAVGRADVFGSLGYGEASDTWSANPLGCAAVLATLDCFAEQDVIAHARRVSAVVERGLCRLKDIPFVTAIRGEGMVWGIEVGPHAGMTNNETANACVRAAYLGDKNGDAIHLLGPLAGNVIRVSPPLTMTLAEAEHWMDVLYRVIRTI